jgi:flagellar M-ring protein FliF
VKRFADSLKALGTARLLGIAAVGIAVMAIIGTMALRTATQPMALLYADLELRDSAQVAAQLEKLHVAFDIKAGGAQIFVPSDQVERLRLAMAREGVPSGGSVGYEVFDRGDSLTSNQFQQQINQLRALEGELGRTIRTIKGVRNARVHLVLAKREPFAREQQQAQASIILAMAGPGRMGADEVQAIVNLVASAVPGLKPQNVSVVDNRGELLARSGRGTGRDGSQRPEDDIRRGMEQRLGQAVEDMLGRTLGAGHVRAEASVELDFDRINEVRESYDPDQQVVRSQQSVTDGSKTSEPQANVSVQNNLPNPESQTGGAAGTASTRQEENTSYEIGKTVRTMVRDTPTIRRVSMAVLVDGTTVRSPEGAPAWRELSQPDLDRIAALVRSAIGFDAKRGDKVEVVNMRFSEPEELPDFATPATGWLNLSKSDLTWLLTLAAVSVVAVFALGFVVRPIGLRLVTGLGPVAALAPPREMSAIGAELPGGLALPGLGDAGPLGSPLGSPLAAPPASPGLPAPPADADGSTMLNVAAIQGQVRASSIRQIAELVEQRPEASVTVIRGWLNQRGG